MDSQQLPRRIYSVLLRLRLLEGCLEGEVGSERRQRQRSGRQRREEDYSVKRLSRLRRSASVRLLQLPLLPQVVSSVNSRSRTRSALPLPLRADYSVNRLSQLLVASHSVRSLPSHLPELALTPLPLQALRNRRVDFSVRLRLLADSALLRRTTSPRLASINQQQAEDCSAPLQLQLPVVRRFFLRAIDWY